MGKLTTTTAIKRLETAITEYDRHKAEHQETTQALTEAKKHVDLCARAVVDAENGVISLFDREDERPEDDEAAAPARKRGRRKPAFAGASA